MPTVTSKGREAFTFLLPELVAFYRSLWPKPKTDARLAALIEKRFGDVIAERICRPLGIHEGACLTVAIALIREQA